MLAAKGFCVRENSSKTSISSFILLTELVKQRLRAHKDYCYGTHDRNDFEEAAYQRWRNAVRELGLGLSGLVISTVCHDLLPLPRDIDTLRLGLEKLIDWYGLPYDR